MHAIIVCFMMLFSSNMDILSPEWQEMDKSTLQDLYKVAMMRQRESLKNFSKEN